MLQIEMPQTSYKEILQRLVKRYLFKLERMKEEGEVSSFTSHIHTSSTRIIVHILTK